ncbi:MAG: hypothetical protein H7Z41_17035, partial [Cytophagales bacterium]|nr:hypothetical protein [Armatimonadota bacterium]
DHLHLLLSLPPIQSLRSIEDELLRASQRFLREAVGCPLFAWASGQSPYQSISLHERETVTAYVVSQREQHSSNQLWDALEATGAETSTQPKDSGAGSEEAMPDWLRAAMRSPGSPG